MINVFSFLRVYDIIGCDGKVLEKKKTLGSQRKICLIVKVFLNNTGREVEKIKRLR
jgi:hypothetical protein